MMTKFLAELSRDAYNDRIVREGYKSQFIEDKDTQCHILWNDDEVYIVFRGTEGVLDWATNVRFGLNELGCHSGFYKAYSAVKEELFEALSLIDYKKKNIFLTGHSLGSALAIICANDIKNIKRVETFGGPMIGNKYFHEDYNHHFKTFIWQNGFDIVPRLPSDKIGYKYVGQIRYMTKWSNRVKDYRPWLADKLSFSKKDHSMNNYIIKLGRIL